MRWFDNEFPTDEECLEHLFDCLYRRDCYCGGTYKLIKFRSQFQCSKCRNQITPTTGTVLRHSKLPLMQWFYGVYIFNTTGRKMSAKTLQEHLGVSEKAAKRVHTFVLSTVADKLFSS